MNKRGEYWNKLTKQRWEGEITREEELRLRHRYAQADAVVKNSKKVPEPKKYWSAEGREIPNPRSMEGIKRSIRQVGFKVSHEKYKAINKGMVLLEKNPKYIPYVVDAVKTGRVISKIARSNALKAMGAGGAALGVASDVYNISRMGTEIGRALRHKPVEALPSRSGLRVPLPKKKKLE
jgi:hypothetical protein